MIPGEYRLEPGSIELNEGRRIEIITVLNTGDRPVQIGSHFHFFEVNRQLVFDREKTLGMRLNIAAGTAVRFEPGEEKEVQVVSFGGRSHMYGFNNLVDGNVADKKQQAMEKSRQLQFKNSSR